MNSFQKTFEELSKFRKELTPPWWRTFDFGVEFCLTGAGGDFVKRTRFLQIETTVKGFGQGLFSARYFRGV